MVVLGMHGKGANSGNIRSLQCPQHCIFQKPSPQSVALPRKSDGKTGKQHDRHRVTGESLGQPFKGTFVLDLPDNQGVVADYHIVREHKISPGCACLLILEREADEEAIQWLTAAIEAIDRVAAFQFFKAE